MSHSTIPAEVSTTKSDLTRPAGRFGETALFALAAALACCLAQRAQLLAVWRDGAFFDSDDAMHMVQVRALLAGQGWYDMLVPRLDPPAGTVMHWSRLADLPTAALVWLFERFAGAATAERLACLALPFLLSLALFTVLARLARLLLGPDAAAPMIVGVLLSGTGLMQFTPGRIDHHAPQVLILLFALTATLEGLDRPRRALPAGLVVGLSLAINLEDMPFFACLAAGLVVLWVWRGEPMRRPLGWFAAGLGLGLPSAYAAVVAPSHYGEIVCDAYGASHIGAGMIAAAGLIALAAPALEGVFDTRWRRMAAATLVAAAALAFVALATPACLGNPFAAVDPLVRRLWLAEVAESLPLPTLLRQDPATAVASALPVALGLAACLVACLVAARRGEARHGTSLRRMRFGLVAAVVGTGLALSFWQVRVLSTVGALAVLGGVYVVIACKAFWLERRRPALASLSIALLFPFTAVAATLAVPAPATSPPAAGGAAASDCLAPSAFAPLAGWRGTVDAPLDAGSFLLAHTGLSPDAAAFHRDNDGNRFHFDLATATPADAERIARSRRLDLVLVCAGWMETAHVARRDPGSLAAALLAGRAPPWLEPLAMPGTPIRAYRLRPSS